MLSRRGRGDAGKGARVAERTIAGVGACRCALLPLFVVLGMAVPGLAAAQTPSYTDATIGCARFSESVRGRLESAFGSARRAETLGRDGAIEARAVPDSAGLAVEAWYDTLTVFREGPEGRFAPDADGIFGGRYLGLLDPQGDYLSSVTPYVPAALRDIFDFSRILLHFFPPLSPTPLLPGEEWSDGSGLTIWRLADSASAGGSVSRYRWIRRERWDEGVGVGDSTVVVHRRETEDGRVQWRAGEGPVGWDGTMEASLEFTNGAGQSALTQEFRVRREPGSCR
jgi:hypothetical protein